MKYFTEQPNKWVILRITHEGTSIYKLLAGWYGGYLGSDEWRLSSGIVKVEKEGNFIFFTNGSGSVYKCDVLGEGLTGFTAHKFSWLKQQETDSLKIDMVDYEQFRT